MKFRNNHLKLMSFRTYLEEKKELQDCLLGFIDHDGIDDRSYQKLINVIKHQQISEIRSSFLTLLHLLNAISTNHHRTSDLYAKIDKILSYLKKDIKREFTNLEIFHIFKQNKRVLLSLIQNDLFTIDQTIADVLLKSKYYKLKYPHYFYPEIKQFLLDDKLRHEIEKEVTKYSDNFDENRKIGENHTKICSLIRNDSIEDFKSHVTQEKQSSYVEFSIFETNPLLLKNKVYLLEYSAFFGSIQIFNFLKESDRITSETWIYAVHGNNLEIIKTIQDKKIRPKDSSFALLLKECFRCQHHELASYVKDNLLQIRKEKENLVLSECIKFYDYSNFPQELNNQAAFYNFCYADNASFVSGLLGLVKKDFKINELVSNIIIIQLFYKISIKILLMEFQSNFFNTISI